MSWRACSEVSGSIPWRGTRRVDEIGHGVDVTWETFRVDRGRVVGRYAAPGMRSMAQIASQVNETVSPGVYCV